MESIIKDFDKAKKTEDAYKESVDIYNELFHNIYLNGYVNGKIEAIEKILTYLLQNKYDELFIKIRDLMKQ